MTTQTPYTRVLLKLSGEAFSSEPSSTISQDALERIANGIKDLSTKGIQVGVVIGAGNIFRGSLAESVGIERVLADQMGMLGTIINAIALQQALERKGQKAHILSAIYCSSITEPYSWKRARDLLENKTVVIFAGGTGNPYFTTDTAAALRAAEIEAQILLKATKVSGVYSQDPVKYPDAVRYETISFSEVLAQKLEVMDGAAIALCMSSKIPIFVFNMWETPHFFDALVRKSLGTFVHL